MSALRSIFSPDAIRRNLASVARRFPFPFAYISSLTVWLIIMLWTNVERNHALSDSMCWALSEGLLLSMVANIWCEFMGWMRRIKPVQLAVLGLVVLDFVAMYMRGGVVATAESVAVRHLCRPSLPVYCFCLWQSGTRAVSFGCIR